MGITNNDDLTQLRSKVTTKTMYAKVTELLNTKEGNEQDEIKKAQINFLISKDTQDITLKKEIFSATNSSKLAEVLGKLNIAATNAANITADNKIQIKGFVKANSIDFWKNLFK